MFSAVPVRYVRNDRAEREEQRNISDHDRGRQKGNDDLELVVFLPVKILEKCGTQCQSAFHVRPLSFAVERQKGSPRRDSHGQVEK